MHLPSYSDVFLLVVSRATMSKKNREEERLLERPGNTKSLDTIGLVVEMDEPGWCRGGLVRLMARFFFVVQLSVVMGSLLQLTRAYSWAPTYDATVWLIFNVCYTGIATLFWVIGLCIRGAYKRSGRELYPVVYSTLASHLYLLVSAFTTAVPTALVSHYYIYYNGAKPTLYNSDTDTQERLMLWIGLHIVNICVGVLGWVQFFITVQFPFSFYVPRVVTELKVSSA